MLDIATILGILIGFGCVFVAVMADGGNFGLFLHIPALVIVIGGTLAATCVHFSLRQVLSLSSFIKKTFSCKMIDENTAVQKLVDLAAISRRDGVLALEQALTGVSDSFLVKSVRLVIDGMEPEAIREHLDREIANLQERHWEGKKMLEFMGGGCPAFGMVGTLIGLVQMFSHMESPEKIGKGMSVALVCTFIGAFFANLFFLPLAGKLGIRSKKETFVRTMIAEGVLALAMGKSPSAVREVMQSFVSERHRDDVRPNATKDHAQKAA